VGAGTRETPVDGPVAPSEITTVVVHAAGAVCTRRARFDVPPGAGSPDAGGPVVVRVTGLPVSLHEDSLRGRISAGPAGLRIADIRVEYGATLRRGDELPGLWLDFEDAEDRQARLRDRTDRLRKEIAEVAALRAEPPAPRRGDPPRWAPVESILALASFVDSRLAALHRRLREAEDELERATHASDVLQHRMDEASSALDTGRTSPSVTALVTLIGAQEAAEAEGSAADGEAAGAARAVELDLEYHVPGACWLPVYQLRLDGRSGQGTLVLRATVAQRTGEDWSGVRLGLSTADLLRRADLPELRSLRIGRRQAEPAALSWREPPAGLADLFAGYDAAAVPLRLRGGERVVFHDEEPAPGTRYGTAYAAASADEGPGGLLLGAVGGGGPIGAPPPPPSFGAPPPPPAPMAQPGAPAASAPVSRKAARTRAAAFAPAAEGFADVSPEPPGTAAPGADLLDYARLTLAGPDAGEDRRGTLRPSTVAHPVAAEYRLRAASVARLPRPAHAVDVRSSAGSFDYRFDTAAPVDVAADGRWHTVPVGEVPVSTEFEYVTVPAVDPAVFGTVLLTNTSPHALLAGPVDVMVDGDFVLTAPLPTLAPGRRESVGLGVAESVKVARRAHMHESTAGLRGGTTVLEHTVEVDVANRLPYPVTVQVRERVPVTADKDVRIDEHKASPPWTPAERPVAGQEDEYVRGLRSWRVALEPGGTATLTGSYAVRLPAGKAVVGGNRRN
jgi:hypothetical protein